MRRLLPLLLLTAACSQGPAPTGPDAGKAYFKQVGCLSCHRVGGEGSATGPDLTFVGFRHSEEWLALWMKDPQAWKPDTLMPNTRLPDSARAAIVGWMAGLKGQDAPPGRRAWDDPSLLKDPVARGRVIYARAGCVACHGLGGKGGYPNNNAKGGVIPGLLKVSEGYNKAELVKKIRLGVPRPEKADPAGAAPLVGMPAWGGVLDDAELDAVASYLLSLSPAGASADGW
ncbi:MAG: c-type cytochrome [Elusimicrobiota bacterium]|nr:c-type cytochrome [Elusimicrobiota bacterium]